MLLSLCWLSIGLGELGSAAPQGSGEPAFSPLPVSCRGLQGCFSLTDPLLFLLQMGKGVLPQGWGMDSPLPHGQSPPHGQ